MTPAQQPNIADEQFDVTLTGDEIKHLLKAVETATSLWAKNRRQCPASINLDVLTEACNKVAYSIDRPHPHAPDTMTISIKEFEQYTKDKQEQAARAATLAAPGALERDFKGWYVEDAVAEIRKFPNLLNKLMGGTQ
jgi:hypothetical protein